jgi:predicted RNase H-like HicB family nuclease
MMNYKGYVGQVEYDDATGIFRGEIINVRDVITFQGTTAEELRRAFQESVDDYLEFCAQRGEEPDQPSTVVYETARSQQTALRDAESGGRGFQLIIEDDVARFELPSAVHQRLQELLDRQDNGQELTVPERREAEGLVELAEFLSLLRLRAKRVIQQPGYAYELYPS